MRRDDELEADRVLDVIAALAVAGLLFLAAGGWLVMRAIVRLAWPVVEGLL